MMSSAQEPGWYDNEPLCEATRKWLEATGGLRPICPAPIPEPPAFARLAAALAKRGISMEES